MKTSASQRKQRSAAGTPRVRAAHLGPERRRPEILDVASELFLGHGYRGTSMLAIAQAAGVSKPVVYACFATKADLFAAVLDREQQRMLDQFRAALDGGGVEGVESGDLQGALATAFTAMLQAVLDTPPAYRALLLGGGDADAVVDTRVNRVPRARERQIAAISALAGRWLDATMPSSRAESAAQFLGHTLVAVAEAGIRMLLADPDRWTPQTLGPLLGGLAAGGYGALLGD